MQNYKVISILKALDKREFRKLDDFVRSPYFNKNKNTINLFNELAKFHPKFSQKNLTIENLFIKLFPKEKFDYHKIHNVISDLYQQIEKFLSQINFERRDFYLQRSLIPELRHKQLPKIYEQKFTSYMKKLIDVKVKDENYFYYLYEMNDDYLWYATYKNPNKDLKILQVEFDNFLKFSLIRLMRFYNLMLHERNQNNVDYNFRMMDEVCSYLKSNPIDNPTALVFYNVLLMLRTKELKYYLELKSLKEKYYRELSRDDQYLLFIHLYDYCAYMVNFKGDDTYNADMLEIYKEMIEERFMTKDNFLFPNFMNVVKVACKVKEFDYAEKFIKDFQQSIPQAEKENVLAFCYGTLENSKGNFETALKHFSKANFQNFLFKVQVKILLLKIFYKLERYEEAFGMIDTFRHFISREKHLLTEHRESYKIFLKLISDLIKLKENPDKKESGLKLKKIKEETETMAANPFGIKAWLIEKISEIEIN